MIKLRDSDIDTKSKQKREEQGKSRKNRHTILHRS